MKKSLIVIKPFDVKLPPDCIKDCWSNNNDIFGAIYWTKESTIKQVCFEKLWEVEKWAEGLDENTTAYMHFGGRRPIKDAAMPFFKDIGEDYLYYFHAGDLDIVNSSGNEDLALYDAFFSPISFQGMISLATELAKNSKNGQFLLYSNQAPYVHKLGEGWETVDGIEYSNSDYKKKVTPTYPPYLTPPKVYSDKKEEKAPPEEIEFFGLRLAKPLEGISRYFGLPKSTIARVVSSKNPLFQPMDWIMTIAGTEFNYSDLPDFVRRKSSKQSFSIHIKILRIDQIAYSRGEDKAKSEFNLQLEYGERPTTLEVLNEQQRNFMIVQLVNKLFHNHDATIKAGKRLKFENSPDAVLIQMCEDNEIKEWEKIHS